MQSSGKLVQSSKEGVVSGVRPPDGFGLSPRWYFRVSIPKLGFVSLGIFRQLLRLVQDLHVEYRHLDISELNIPSFNQVVNWAC